MTTTTPIDSIKSASATKPEVPEVGQTRRVNHTTATLEIVDYDRRMGRRGCYLCQYDNGDEEWHAPEDVAMTSIYISGPVMLDPDLIHRNRVKRALASPKVESMRVSREAAKLTLLSMPNPHPHRENAPDVDDMIKAVGLMAVYGRAALPRMFDLDLEARAHTDTISAVKAFVEGHGGKVVWGSTKDAASKQAHPLHCDPAVFGESTKGHDYNTRIDRAVATLEYLLRHDGWKAFKWSTNETARPYPQRNVISIEVSMPGETTDQPNRLSAEYGTEIDGLARLDAILMLAERMIWNACARITEKHAKVVAAGCAAADEIAKVAAAPTPDDITNLSKAISYLNSRGWTTLSPDMGSLRGPSFVYTSVEAAKANLAPGRLLIGTRSGHMLDLPKAAISFPLDGGARIDVSQAWLRATLGIEDEPSTENRAPGRVVSATLGSTTFDRDSLALDYIGMRGKEPNCGQESLAKDAYEYADAMIRASAAVPDDVKAIQACEARVEEVASLIEGCDEDTLRRAAQTLTEAADRLKGSARAKP